MFASPLASDRLKAALPRPRMFAATAFFALLACGQSETAGQHALNRASSPLAARADRPAPAPATAASALDTAVSAFVARAGSEPTDEYESARLDLNADGREDGLVMLSAPDWCGSGGCTLLVFEGTADGFELVSETSLVNGPLLVAETQTNGWRDILIPDPSADRTVALQYGGSGYPTEPEGPTPQNTAGDVLFEGEVGLP